MSFILDALTKAAEQRAEQTPALHRLVSEPPDPSAPSAAPRVAVGLSIAAAVMVAVVVVTLRPAGPPVPPLADETPKPAASTAVPAAPEPPHVEPPAGAVARAAPLPPRVTPVVPERPAPSLAPEAPVRPPAVSAPAPRVAPPPTRPPENVARLKLEVLVYSDVRTERMVFINGRKYVEGDTVAEGGRLEEIKQDGVVLSDQGRRFTLRQ